MSSPALAHGGLKTKNGELTSDHTSLAKCGPFAHLSFQCWFAQALQKPTLNRCPKGVFVLPLAKASPHKHHLSNDCSSPFPGTKGAGLSPMNSLWLERCSLRSVVVFFFWFIVLVFCLSLSLAYLCHKTPKPPKERKKTTDRPKGGSCEAKQEKLRPTVSQRLVTTSSRSLVHRLFCSFAPLSFFGAKNYNRWRT